MIIKETCIPKIAIIEEQNPEFLDQRFDTAAHKDKCNDIDTEYHILCNNIKRRLIWLYDNNYRILIIIGRHEGINSIILCTAQELKQEEGLDIALFLVENHKALLYPSNESIKIHGERVCLL